MIKTLRPLAVAVAVLALGLWLLTGAHRGWTQTRVPKKTVDDVTGLEAITYEPRFVMGVDILGAVWLGAGLLAGITFLVPNKHKQPIN